MSATTCRMLRGFTSFVQYSSDTVVSYAPRGEVYNKYFNKVFDCYLYIGPDHAAPSLGSAFGSSPAKML